MNFPNAEFINRPEANIAIYQSGPQDGPAVLLVHGWPEIAYSWKHQIPALAAAGYRVIAMDVRGFGRSSAPQGIHHYQISNLISDMEAVLDALSIKQAVICGHDWGGIIVWHAARMIAPRVSGVISICTPHLKRPPADPIAIFENRFGPDHYFVDFVQNPGAAEALFSQNINAFFRLMFRKTPKVAQPSKEMYYIPRRFEDYLAKGAPDLGGLVMSEADLQIYVDAYAKSGFHGGVNLYRNTGPNWALTEGLSDRITQPSLMISAAQDLFLPPAATDPMPSMIADLKRVIIEDCGHWAMWEQPEAVNRAMLEWLGC